jgi:hypothetical protein
VTAKCHPGKEHVAHGLCGRCYQVKYRKDGKIRRRNSIVIPEFPPDYRRILPFRTAGVQQNAVTEFPVEICPKCGLKGSMMYTGREARCAGMIGGCGHTLYLVKDGPAEIPSFQAARLLRQARALKARTSESVQRPYASDLATV